ncbi:MAG: hypothetical protein HC929_16120 [Leptolyngbyaceae cyanobacterium SM2_5_2]|nr:hypothetical protein [Leptolyngbyaceae cyanobacterium SM2_5_2]
MPGVLAAAEALELMFNVEDALELGLLLVAMGLENTSQRSHLRHPRSPDPAHR